VGVLPTLLARACGLVPRRSDKRSAVAALSLRRGTTVDADIGNVPIPDGAPIVPNDHNRCVDLGAYLAVRERVGELVRDYDEDGAATGPNVIAHK